ncbi:MAG: hypothetical protein AVDCRST_MAG56-2813 [uncultured Cytophagales bacterium]|uniref:Uncharacterized protein n=1 Tax=uncultured Cytophagales bacterium TaxID=158755 RepID=A0A6J4IZW9_9SPHI|nr:MAG: hypothetical protein AVDCRST_MAG56-2813 [uncultured Cytophagales bacterium]
MLIFKITHFRKTGEAARALCKVMPKSVLRRGPRPGRRHCGGSRPRVRVRGRLHRKSWLFLC